nr:glycosyltransferase [bacterium]
IADSIRFTGMVAHEEMPEYLAAADVGVATFEDTEAVSAKSPLKIAEYLASGLPIVASRVGEVSRMVGEAGLLVPPGDSEAVAEAVLRILADSDTIESLGRAARQRAEAIYNWDQTASNLIQAYRRGIQDYE